MVCDHSKKVRSLTAKWPGSTHDARIWRECHLSNQFKQGSYQIHMSMVMTKQITYNLCHKRLNTFKKQDVFVKHYAPLHIFYL